MNKVRTLSAAPSASCLLKIDDPAPSIFAFDSHRVESDIVIDEVE
jgi:hypothetical protein